jgi:hypothetical protein
MKTVNTVVANLERIIKFSKAKEESNIYLYWKIGRELSFACKLNKYGRHFIDDIVYGLQKKGFIDNSYRRRALYRMQQFFAVYPDWQKFGSLLSEISWSTHVLILGSIDSEDKTFWLVLCMEKQYTVRQLKKVIEKWKDGKLFRSGNENKLLQLSELDGIKTHQKVTFEDISYIIPTLDELKSMKEVDIHTIGRDELVDIGDIL